MDSETQTNLFEVISPVKPPEFDSRNIRVWLLQVEAHFQSRRITSQNTKFFTLVSALPTGIVEQLLDVIDPMPTNNPYDMLKYTLLTRLTASDDQRLQQLLSGVELGDRTPSQLLRHMKSMVCGLKVDESIFRQLWMKQLPTNMKAILSASGVGVSLDSLAQMADKIHECFSPCMVAATSELPEDPTTRVDRLEQGVANLTQEFNRLSFNMRRNSRSHSPTRVYSPTRQALRFRPICRYHRKFGAQAKHCSFPCHHPYSFYKTSNKPGNDSAR